MFTEAGWRQTTNGRNTDERLCYVPIREPISRWFSGARTYARSWGLDYDELVETVRQGGYPVLDRHTQPQTEFLLSTYPNRVLVRLEDAADYVHNRWGLTLPAYEPEAYISKQDGESVWRVLTDFYSADVELYESIPSRR